MEKYNNNFDTFRAIPNELTLAKERDTLTKEVEQFNTSKVYSGVGRNQEGGYEMNGMGAYTSLKELPSQTYINKQDETLRIAS